MTYYDDESGHIGGEYDIVGHDGDEALLEALSVSGEGNTEIIGDDQILVGQQRRRGSPGPAVRQIAMRDAAAVVKRGLDRRRRYPLGFAVTNVLAAATNTIPASPQNLYRPERLVIPSDIAFDLGVADVKVGNQSQFAQSEEVPAALFSEVAINTGVTFDTAEVGNQVSVQVRNKSGATVSFSAALVGTIAK